MHTSTDGYTIGPPAEREYPVDPVGVEKINPSLFRQVRSVLDENKAQRHIRGGLATREKYKKQMR